MFWKFHLYDFYIFIATYHASKFEINPWHKTWHISLHNIWPKEIFFWKFHPSDFYLLIVLYHDAKFEKTL